MSLIFRKSFIVLLITILSKIIFATNCIPSASLNYYYWNSPNVVSAEVIEIVKVEKDLVISRVRFKVIDVIKGDVKPNAEIIIEQRFNYSCSEYDYEKDEKYLLFLGEPEQKDKLLISPLQFYNANAVSELSNKSIQNFLELLNNGIPDYQIEGLIWSDYKLKLSKIEVKAKNSQKSYKVEILDHKQYSDFSIQVDEPGIYEVSVTIPRLNERLNAIRKSFYTFEFKIKQLRHLKKKKQTELVFEVNVEAEKFPYFDISIVER